MSYKKWTKEDDLYIVNAKLKKESYQKIANYFNCSLTCIKSRYAYLMKKDKKNYTKEIKEQGMIYKYNKDFGIKLDKNLLIHTYDIIQWWKWFYYKTPNGKTLSCIPICFYKNTNELIKVIRYVINNEIKYDTREKLLNITLKDLNKYKIYFNENIASKLIDYLNVIFPEYNIHWFELYRVPCNSWKDKNKCDEYMNYILNNELQIYTQDEAKDKLPSFFKISNLILLGYKNLLHCLNNYKHYNSFYEWVSFLHPEWNLKNKDFNTFYGIDGAILNSNEELQVYNLIKAKYKLNIKSIGMQRKKYKYYNDKYKENYIPDFIIDKINSIQLSKPIIIEYYGLFDLTKVSKFIINYNEKTLRKNEFYKSNKDIYFIDLYPEDLKNKFQGVREKLTSFFMLNFNIDINKIL